MLQTPHMEPLWTCSTVGGGCDPPELPGGLQPQLPWQPLWQHRAGYHLAAACACAGRMLHAPGIYTSSDKRQMACLES